MVLIMNMMIILLPIHLLYWKKWKISNKFILTILFQPNAAFHKNSMPTRQGLVPGQMVDRE